MAHDAHPLAGERVWARRRGRALSLLVGVAATVFVLSFCLSATVGFVADSSLAGIRTTLSSATRNDSSVVLRSPINGDGSAQDRGVRNAIARTFDGAPVVITRVVDTSKPGSTAVRWTITPSLTLTTPDTLARLHTGFTHIEAAVTASREAHSPAVQLSGHGASTALTMQRAVDALDAIEPIPLTVLSLAGIVALILARNLLTDYRQNETRFLRSRGGSGAMITMLDARESAIVCLVGAVAGAIVAQVALLVLVGPPVGIVGVLAPPGIVFAIALAVNVTFAGLAARTASGVPRAESGRGRAAAPWTLTGFGVVITGIALWRFEQSGSDGASFAADPSAVLAPGALLCAGTLLCLLAAGRVTARIETVLRSHRSASLFPVRSVNRHITIVVGPSALLAIAIAIACVTSTYSGTWQRFATDAQQLTTGGDLRASVGAEPVLTSAADLVPLSRFAAVQGVTTAAPAIREVNTFGDLPVTVLAVRASDLSRLVSPGSTVSDPRAIARRLSSAKPQGLALPAGSTSIMITVAATGRVSGGMKGGNTVLTTLWLEDAHGNLFPLALRPVGVASGRTTALSGSLPRPGGPWTVVAIDAGVSLSSTITNFQFRVATVTAVAGGARHKVPIARAAPWTARDQVFNDGPSTPSPTGTIGFDLAKISGQNVGSVSERMMPTGAVTVPVVLSRPFATDTGLVVGSTAAVDGQWASFTGIVTGIVPNVPGAANGSSMIASLPALNRAWLSTSEQIPAVNEVWMTSPTPAATARRLGIRIPDAALTVAGSAGGDQIVRGATVALWIGALGTTAFAIIALAAAAIALLRRRTVETAALRALGVRAATQSALRQREFAIVGAVGLAIGVLVGATVSLLVSGTMARLSTPTAPLSLPLALALDPWPALVTLVTLVLAFIGCLVGYGSAVQRQAGGRP